MNKEIAGKFLIFGLHDQQYGLPIKDVCEINRMTDVTPVPKAQTYVSGVMNLRGRVIPVVDLRVRLGVPIGQTTKHTCILVVERNKDTERRSFGVIVDSVSSVVDFSNEQIDLNVTGGSEFILGMGKSQEDVTILIDVIAAFKDMSLSSTEESVA